MFMGSPWRMQPLCSASEGLDVWKGKDGLDVAWEAGVQREAGCVTL